MILELNSIGSFLMLMLLGTIGLCAIGGFIVILAMLYYDGIFHKWFPFIGDPR